MTAGRLETRRPYERGKVPVVFIHGLWGSPRNWDRMIEEPRGRPCTPNKVSILDRSLRERGLDPLLGPLAAAVPAAGASSPRSRWHGRGLRPNGRRRPQPWRHLGEDDGPERRTAALAAVCARPIDQVIGPTEEWQLLQQAFFYKPVPEVRRVIFIATPHRGSPLASGRLRELGTQLCWRPNRFRQAHEVLLSHNEPDMFARGFRGQLATSAGELAPGHPLLLRLCELGIDSSVRSHSVIADLRDPPRPDGTDGSFPIRARISTASPRSCSCTASTFV